MRIPDLQTGQVALNYKEFLQQQISQHQATCLTAENDDETYLEIDQAIQELKRHVPTFQEETDITPFEILRLAIMYIDFLQQTLQTTDNHQSQKRCVIDICTHEYLEVIICTSIFVMQRKLKK
ncbi:uncharacterized protein TRIADDRAFT_55034 [Trichoplax adhaerens]|uniref:BHLH domain-containing protein n=1 Tax=Trichoplax adhaerens TaxID=10228 RepID=B3RQL8_TRIAD|nr:predicted protein [Trichoplax adhaerens]EDV27271.1 predicted protein [Trichoplax adhaerens]|eukprot:XP_002111267.1 predicted protein [Trichoplax adhaerens]